MLMTAALLLFIAVFIAIVGYAVGTLFQALDFSVADKPAPLFYGFRGSGLPVTLLVSASFLGLLTYLLFIESLHNQIIATDEERGLHFLKDETGGGSRWMPKNEIPEVFYVGNVKNTTSTIYGQLTEKGENVVAWKKKEHGASGNRNDIIIASMGSGKTFTYVYNELIQTILRGDSFVVMDPKGECFQNLFKFCQSRGVDVHVLNMDKPKYSEFWDCLQETINPKTERLDGTRLNEFVSIYMENTYDAGTKKDFWYDSALNLTKAVIGYTAYVREMEIIDGFIDLYKEITGASVDNRIIYRMQNSMCSFVWCKEKILEAARQNGYDEEYVRNLLHDIQYKLPTNEYNLGVVVDKLLSFAEISSDLEEIATWHPASVAYRMYMTNDTEQVRKSALQGAQMRFSIFSDNDLKEALSHPGINISNINQKQTAFFVIMSDKTNTTKPFVSLFTSFLFKDAMETYDENGQIYAALGKPNPTLGVTVMLEEFFSVGVIGGNPETFGMYMSTARSRKLYIKVIIQYYTQLEALYGENIKHAIQGGCSTLLYLGGNDPETCKFISFFTGTATILSETHRERSRLLMHARPLDDQTSVSGKSRPLLTEDDARRWKGRTLIIKQGEYPLPVNPFPWTDHWVCREGLIKMDENGNVMPESIMSLFDYLEPIEIRAERIIDERLRDDPDPKTSIHNRIILLKQHKANTSHDSDAYEIDSETGEVMVADFRIVTSDEILEEYIPEESMKPSAAERKESKPKKEVRKTKTRKPYDKTQAINSGIPRHAKKKKSKTSLIDNE
jgi:type IV secretory pathway TraG/TraD family ATPase VirD4